MLNYSARKICPKVQTVYKQKNTRIWNDEIALALLNNKKALFVWTENGKPKSGKSATQRKKHHISELHRARRHDIPIQWG